MLMSMLIPVVAVYRYSWLPARECDYLQLPDRIRLFFQQKGMLAAICHLPLRLTL